MKLLVIFLGLTAVSSTAINAQAPVTQIEGYLEVYHPIDTTSVYIGNDVGRIVQVDTDDNEHLKSNTFVGNSSGESNTSGYYNSFFGRFAGASNTSGRDNSFFGKRAGFSNISGRDNSFFGSEAGFSNTGRENSFFGSEAGYKNEGFENSFFGTSAGYNNSTGGKNTFIGRSAGSNIMTESNNIAIGYSSGPTFQSAENDRLYIDIKQSDNPLVYGEFDNDLLRINGRFQTRVENEEKAYIGLFEQTGVTLFGYEFEYDGADDKLHLWSRGFSGNVAKRMTWLKDGKVGINKDNPTVALDVVGQINATGSINPSSDVNLKELFRPINTKDVLKRIEELPISEWQYKASPDRHIGPMAQDFYAAFRLGQGETTIATVDADGVALAAIKALAEENTALKIATKELKLQNEDLQQRNAEIELRLTKIESLLAKEK